MMGTMRWTVAAMLAATAALAGCGSHVASEDRIPRNELGRTAGIDTAPRAQPSAAVPPVAPDPEAGTPTPVVAAAAAASPGVDGDAAAQSCTAQIGAVAAKKKAEVCRNVSPATRPPCNAANSCAMIDDEIARGCAFFDAATFAKIPACSRAPATAEAAAVVVQQYYFALTTHNYDAAWLAWGPKGRPGQTKAAFVQGFAHTQSTSVTIGDLGPVEGAAGSSYVTVPVTVNATLDDGSKQRFVGQYVVRRTNNVDGAPPAAMRWHLDSASLRPA